MKVYDAEGHILGRLASVVAKELLNGEEVRVVNARKSIITGKKKMVIKRYKKKRELTHRRKGPFYPKRSDRIFKRTVRGMLPMKKHRGKIALKRLKVDLGVPPKLENAPKLKVEDAMRTSCPNFIELGEIGRVLGSK